MCLVHPSRCFGSLPCRVLVYSHYCIVTDSPLGLYLWLPPPGQRLRALEPREVGVKDIVGLQGGGNHWVGLRTVAEDLLPHFWQRVLWPRHACDQCRRDIVLDEGETTSVRVMACDGVTNTRWAKCAILDCEEDLPSLGGESY